jgi:CheY-like chemotaxis protein
MIMNTKQKTVLIVEDESSLNEAYQIVLAQAGYDILSAFDGAQALEITKEVMPDVILLDLRMPVMDGISFLKEFNPENHKSTKIIVFSNYDMQKEVDEAYSLGAHKYILKAWASPKELLKIVNDALQS